MNLKINYILLLLVLIIMNQCTKEKKNNVRLDIQWSKRGKLDYIEKYNRIAERKQNGELSFVYESFDKESGFNFKFSIDSSSAFYQTNKDTFKLELLAKDKYNVLGKEYEVYNFLRFIPIETDNAINLFFVKEFGVINILNTSYMNKGIIQFHEDKIYEIVNELNKQLMEDTSFYIYHNNLPPLP